MRTLSEWGFWSWTGTATQAAAGGGLVVLDLTAGVGNIVHVLYARAIGTFAGVDTLSIRSNDEDNNFRVLFAQLGAAGTINLTIPRALTDVDSTTNNSFASSLG